jgi:hypothetical protein
VKKNSLIALMKMIVHVVDLFSLAHSLSSDEVSE